MRRRSGLLGTLVVDALVIGVLAVGMILLAQVARDAVLRSADVSMVAPHTGFLWALARASWSVLVLVAVGIAALYALAFRRGTIGFRALGRHPGGVLVPLVVMLVLFALPIGVVAGAARLASRQPVTPPEQTPLDVSGEGNAPAIPTGTPAPTPAPTDNPNGAAAPVVATAGRAPVPTSAAAGQRSVPLTPQQPKLPPTPVPTAAPKATPKVSPTPQKQTGGGQHQSQ